MYLNFILQWPVLDSVIEEMCLLLFLLLFVVLKVFFFFSLGISVYLIIVIQTFESERKMKVIMKIRSNHIVSFILSFDVTLILFVVVGCCF